MEILLQDDILAIVLLSFDENTKPKFEAFKKVFQEFDGLISKATRKVLENTISFIDFIDNLYSEEDKQIKGILRILKNETIKELDYRIDESEMCINCKVDSIETQALYNAIKIPEDEETDIIKKSV